MSVKVSDEIVKSLAEDLGMKEDEIRSLLKSEDSEEEKEDKEEDEEKEEDEKESEKSEKQDITSMSDDDIKKSISGLVQELNKRKPEVKIEKSENDNLLKSLTDEFQKSISSIKEDLQKSVTESISAINSKVEEIQKSVNSIGENSKGLKGMRFDFIEKAGDTAPIVKDGVTYLSSSDRNGISEAMLDIVEKSENEDLKKSVSADLINYQGSGELSKRAITNLNKNGFYFKEQMK